MKSLRPTNKRPGHASLPMRERGLKYQQPLLRWVNYKSLPMRERGLKYRAISIRHLYAVAPYAGAWIEIDLARQELNRLNVAPYAGAWIEMSAVIA